MFHSNISMVFQTQNTCHARKHLNVAITLSKVCLVQHFVSRSSFPNPKLLLTPNHHQPLQAPKPCWKQAVSWRHHQAQCEWHPKSVCCSPQLYTQCKPHCLHHAWAKHEVLSISGTQYTSLCLCCLQWGLLPPLFSSFSTLSGWLKLKSRKSVFAIYATTIPIFQSESWVCRPDQELCYSRCNATQWVPFLCHKWDRGGTTYVGTMVVNSRVLMFPYLPQCPSLCVGTWPWKTVACFGPTNALGG